MPRVRMTSISHPVALAEVGAVPKAVTRNSALNLALTQRLRWRSYALHSGALVVICTVRHFARARHAVHRDQQGDPRLRPDAAFSWAATAALRKLPGATRVLQ